MKSLYCFLAVLLCQWSTAQSPSFSMEVSSDTVGLDEVFTVTYTAENMANIKFSQPIFKGFKVISGPNTSTAMSMMNGKVSQSSSHTYYLQPEKEGVATIPSMKVADLTADERKIVVVKSTGKKTPPKKAQESLFYDPFSSFFENPFMAPPPVRKAPEKRAPEKKAPEKKYKGKTYEM